MQKTVTTILFFLGSIIVTSNSLAQTKRIDSLRTVLQAEKKEDTNRANTLIELGSFLLNMNFTDSGYYKEIRQIAMEAISIADKTNFPKAKGEATQLFGEMDEFQRRFPEAHRNYE